MDNNDIVYELTEQWDELIIIGKCFDGEDELFNTDYFAECMRETFHYFFDGKERAEQLTKAEIVLYGYIFAYTKLPVEFINENSEDFEKSQLAADVLAHAILGEKEEYIFGTKLRQTIYNDESFVEYEYDITTDDMGRITELSADEGAMRVKRLISFLILVSTVSSSLSSSSFSIQASASA